MRVSKLSIIIFIIVSFSYCQTFDPETGEMIADSTKIIRFDPETGLLLDGVKPVLHGGNRALFNVFSDSVRKVLPKLPDPGHKEVASGKTQNILNKNQINFQAKMDAKNKFNSAPWIFIGGPFTVGLSLTMGGISAGIFDEFLDEGFFGFLLGTGSTAVLVPNAMSKMALDIPLRTVNIANERYPDKDQRSLYMKSYKNEIIRLRKKAIQNGELVVVGGFFAFIILMVSTW